MRNVKRIAALFLIFVVIAFYSLPELRAWIVVDTVAERLEWLRRLEGRGAAAFVLLYVIATLVGVPGTPLSLLGGAAFGNGWGFVWVLVGANLGANFAFLAARYLARDPVVRWIRRLRPEWERGIERRGFHWMMGLRIIPIFPFALVNYGAGVSPVSWRDFTLATLLGMLPAMVVYVSLGAVLGHAVDRGDSVWDSQIWKQPQVVLSFGFVICGTLLTTWYKKSSGQGPAAGSSNRKSTQSK